jgi:hypothetical protein
VCVLHWHLQDTVCHPNNTSAHTHLNGQDTLWLLSDVDAMQVEQAAAGRSVTIDE